MYFPFSLITFPLFWFVTVDRSKQTSGHAQRFLVTITYAELNTSLQQDLTARPATTPIVRFMLYSKYTSSHFSPLKFLCIYRCTTLPVSRIQLVTAWLIESLVGSRTHILTFAPMARISFRDFATTAVGTSA